MKTAIIIGSEGQDGRIATTRLTDDGLRVVGIGRGTIRDSAGVEGVAVDVTELSSVRSLVERCAPAKIYYLAARHGSSETTTNDEPAELKAMLAVNVEGIANILEAARAAAPDVRIVYAASSRIFGTPLTELQNESTPIAPDCLYGISKAAGLQLCRRYRREHGLHVSAAILYNHESPLRGPSFVSSRIVHGALAIARGESSELVLGDLSAEVDWGWAPDHVDAMLRMARHATPDDYIVATGAAHSLRQFVEAAFACAGLDWRRYVRENAALLGRKRPRMIGDISKLSGATGWRPTVTFGEMVEHLWNAAAKETSHPEPR
ncbi:MAG: GDP-mannose 4,6-dehydratase [Thermoanaerobaculia bacterium]